MLVLIKGSGSRSIGASITTVAGDDIDSSPAIGADDTVYAGSYDTNFYAFNADGN